VSRRTGDAAKFFQAFPRISKLFQAKSKLFQAFSKEIPNIFLGRFQRNQRLGGDSGHFRLFRRLPAQAVPSEPRSLTATAAELRFFSLSRLLLFPKTMLRRSGRAGASLRPRRGSASERAGPRPPDRRAWPATQEAQIRRKDRALTARG
jgi:hypothetical protein